jgi:hypothetical protein
MHNVAKLLKRRKTGWYQSERNTAAMLRTVVSARSGKPLSGDDIWYILQLTWVTRARDHWRKLKVPALLRLFPQEKSVRKPSRDANLQEVLERVSLPKRVAEAAAKTTGIVNFRGTWRNSSRAWCKQNSAELRDMIRKALLLPSCRNSTVFPSPKNQPLPISFRARAFSLLSLSRVRLAHSIPRKGARVFFGCKLRCKLSAD